MHTLFGHGWNMDDFLKDRTGNKETKKLDQFRFTGIDFMLIRYDGKKEKC